MNDLEFDAKHIWHPYTSLPASYPLFEVVKTKDTRITLADGRQLIDGMSSWWSAIHGYNNPKLQMAMCQQIESFSHIMFGGLTHKPAIDLTRQLISLVPNNLTKVFFADSGSVAVEVAIKMALQYQIALGKKNKNKLLALSGSYHGDTFATMAVSDSGMDQVFNLNSKLNLFTPKPKIKFNEQWQQNSCDEIKTIIEQNHQQIAAFIVEPIVQGAGGMYFYHPQYLTNIRKLCDQFDILLIADEIASGFGRTGKLFACEHSEISPDILCIGKALTGGMMSMAATICNDKIATTISSNPPYALMHGPTFMANPLACTTALASIELLLNSDWQQNVKNIESIINTELTDLSKLASVKEVRVLGAIGVIEMTQAVDMAVIQPAFVEAGVWVRPFGRLIYIMPAFTILEQDLVFLCRAICKIVKSI